MAGEPILIVEDNEINMMLLNVLLTAKQYDVRAASNAQEALDILSQFHPKLIIMDIQLPGMDGIQLTRKLKADAKYCDIIIVAVTAYALKGDKERILAAGCDGYISKPISPEAFTDEIASYLTKAESTTSKPNKENT